MGSCVSRSGAMSESAAESVHALTTAKVVDLDGSMAQFAAPVTALEALGAIAVAAGITASSPSNARFLCCSDELDFDSPVCALGAGDALRPGQLYFALPTSMLERPLSAQDMAALAVKASAALGTAPVVAAADVEAAGVVPPSLDGGKAGAAARSSKRRRRQTTERRVAPLVVVSAHADGEWESDRVHGGFGDARKAASGDRTVGKARQGVRTQKGVALRVAMVQRLSAIAEAASE
ncbi:unnamed protein product [Urochloa decumbens]|uniref:TMV response-related protein n=1 Tax=Urochloa decumbens TaxID=240449 RepID=A0ABC9FTP3_9POAL